jgi:glycosyltransferase involved in cell wall biosynthesis
VRQVPALVQRPDPISDARAVSQLGHIVRELQPDVVHCHTSKAGLVGRLVAHRRNVPSVYTAHTWAFVEGNSRARVVATSAIERWSARRTTAIVDVSEWNRDAALSKGVGDPHQHTVVHNGVAWTPRREPRPWSDAPLAVVPARLVKQKDHATLLRAVARLDVPLRVRCYGEGPLRHELEELSRSLGTAHRVDFAGNVDRDAMWADADLMVLPTHFEGFPITILEAMRAGVPVVASGVGGVPEAVEHGRTGLVVPPGDAGRLAAAIAALVAEPGRALAMGSTGREVYEARFTSQIMAERTLHVLEAAARERG